jgi:hypothetical protein
LLERFREIRGYFHLQMTYENAEEAAEYIRYKYPHAVKTAVVLGSGLGAFADELANPVRIPYEEIPHFARSTVEGHAGQLVLGEIGGKTVAVQQGRFTFYEGYSMDQVMFPGSRIPAAWHRKRDTDKRSRKPEYGYASRQPDAHHGSFELHGSEPAARY